MTAPPGVGAAADVRETVAGIVRMVLERDVQPSVDVFDQGATSLAFIRIVAEVNERYGIAMEVGELEEASVDSLSALVAEQLKNQETATARN